MKHIRKVQVYGVRNPFKKEINTKQKEDTGVYCENRMRRYTPQSNFQNKVHFNQHIHKDNTSFDLVNTRSESYEIMHWYYTINDQNIDEIQKEDDREMALPKKPIKLNDFEIKLIKGRKSKKDEQIKYKYLYNANNNKDKNNLKTIKPIYEYNELIINPNDDNKSNNNNENEIDDVEEMLIYENKGNCNNDINKKTIDYNDSLTIKEEIKSIQDKDLNGLNYHKEDKQCQVEFNDVNSENGYHEQYYYQQLNESNSNTKTIEKKNSNKKGKGMILKTEKVEVRLKKSSYKKAHPINNYSQTLTTYNVSKDYRIKDSKHNCPCHRNLDSSNYACSHKNISFKLDYNNHNNPHSHYSYQIKVNVPKNGTNF